MMAFVTSKGDATSRLVGVHFIRPGLRLEDRIAGMSEPGTLARRSRIYPARPHHKAWPARRLQHPAMSGAPRPTRVIPRSTPWALRGSRCYLFWVLAHSE